MVRLPVKKPTTGNDAITGLDDKKDKIRGLDGNDMLSGLGGDDRLTGDGGADTLAGGTGADLFIYRLTGDSAARNGKYSKSTGDTITDFSTDEDRIDLSLAAKKASGPLLFTGTTATDSGVWFKSAGKATTVFADVDGNGKADLAIKLIGRKALSAVDFLGLSSRDATATLIIDALTGDNFLSTMEATGNVTVTGKASGEAKAGDTVTLAINNVAYRGTIDANLAFAIAVSGRDLAVDPDRRIEASITVGNITGGTGTASATLDYQVQQTGGGSGTGDITPPSILSVTASNTTALAYGETVDIAVTFDEAMIVIGNPALDLGNGLVATFNGAKSAANTLVFTYVATAGDDGKTPALSDTSLALGTAVIGDAAGNAAQTSLAGEALPRLGSVDAASPAITTVTASTSAMLREGQSVDITITFDEAVNVTGAPELDLGNGMSASYNAAKSNATALVFTFTATAADDGMKPVLSGAILTPGSATLTDAAGNAAQISLGGETVPALGRVDTSAPAIVSVTASSTAPLGPGQTLDIRFTYDEAVIIRAGAMPHLDLGNGMVATLDASRSAGTTLVFVYTAIAADDGKTPQISASSLIVAPGQIRDGVGHDARNTFPAGTQLQLGSVDAVAPGITNLAASTTGSLMAGQSLDITITYGEAVMVSGTPRLNLGNGMAATHDAQKSTATTLVFSYTVAPADDGKTPVLSFDSLAGASGMIHDRAGNPADTFLDWNLLPQFGQVDAHAPSIVSVIIDNSGTLSEAETVDIAITYDEAVILNTGAGQPMLDLGSGLAATFNRISADGKSVIFTYTVAPADHGKRPALDELSLITPTNGFHDQAGNAAQLTLVGEDLPTFGIIDTSIISVRNITVEDDLIGIADTAVFTVHLTSNILIGPTTDFHLHFNGQSTVFATYDAQLSGRPPGSSQPFETNVLVFRYNPAGGDNGIEINFSANGLEVIGLPPTSMVMGKTVTLDLAGVPVEPLRFDLIVPAVRGDGVTTTASDAEISETAPTPYEIRIRMSEAIAVDTAAGTPSIDLGSGLVATFQRVENTDTLVFSFLPSGEMNGYQPNFDGGLKLNGATIKDRAGNDLDTDSMMTAAKPPIGRVDTAALSVASYKFLYLDNSDANGAIFKTGDLVKIRVTFDDGIDMTGAPKLTLANGAIAELVTVSYSGKGDTQIDFTYSVGTGDDNGDEIVPIGFDMADGTLTDDVGHDLVTFPFDQAAGADKIGVDTTAPVITGLAAPDLALSLGETLELRLAFNDAHALFVTGMPSIDIGNGRLARYSLSSTTALNQANVLVFTYQVQAGDSFTPAIGAITLSSGASIKDAAGNDASLVVPESVTRPDFAAINAPGDNAPPDAPTLSLLLDTSANAPSVPTDGGLLGSPTFLIKGSSAEAGSTASVTIIGPAADAFYFNGGIGRTFFIAATQIADGNWTFDLTAHGQTPLTANGAYTITVTATDAAGNESLPATRVINALNGTNGTNGFVGSAFGDVLVCHDGDDTIDGGAGDDILLGGAGHDFLFGGPGADTIDGGPGIDTLDYSAVTTAPVDVHLLAGTASGGGGGNDTLISIEIVFGTALNDTLTGDYGANRLIGGDGNDTLTGGLGIDTLTGGNGADVFIFNNTNGLGIPSGPTDVVTDFKSGVDRIDLNLPVQSGPSTMSVLASEDTFADLAAAAETALLHLFIVIGVANNVLYLFHDNGGSGSGDAIEFTNLSISSELDYSDII